VRLQITKTVEFIAVTTVYIWNPICNKYTLCLRDTFVCLFVFYQHSGMSHVKNNIFK